MKRLTIAAALFALSAGAFAEEATPAPAAPAADAAKPPEQMIVPDHLHSVTQRAFTGIPSLAVAPNGRLWVTWYAGPTPAEDANNYCVLATSDDDGRTWREVFVVDPDGTGIRRAFDPEVWVSPDGRLRWSWADERRGAHATAITWMMTFPDANEVPSAPTQPACVAEGVMMCKPLVLSDGTWLLPTSKWFGEKSSGVTASSDRGTSWSFRGAATVPKHDRNCDEHNIVERKNGDLWVLTRTTSGIREAVSHDKGVTWSPLEPSKIRHTASRFFVRRLQSGNLILVKHGPIDKNVGRRRLTAYVSRDDGATWEGGLLLDERNGAAYPDGDQRSDGLIYIAYDYDRTGAREILFAAFTEEDVLQGRDVSGKVRMRCLVSKGLCPPTGKESRILSALKGTPSEREAPRDILVNKPDYVVFVPKQPRAQEKRDPAKPGDTYNDHFQVICNPSNQHLYAFWTQASREADIDQHIAFSKSVDKGATWTPPVVLAGSPNKKNPALLASWQQPMLSRSGRLYCLWNQQTTSRGPHCGMMFGAFSDDDGETWSAPKLVPFTERMDADPADGRIPPSWCNWQRPIRLGEGGKYFVGCSRHGKAPYDERGGCKIEFWQFENIDDNPPVQDIRIKYLSTNRNALSAKSLEDAGGFRASEPALEEAAPVKLPDGRLFALMRSSVGSPVWVQSRDGGATWSAPKILKDADGKPYLHPRSPCPMYDWKGPEAGSGKYFALVHQTFDFNEPKRNAYQHRGPLYLIAGEFDPAGEQPVKFKAPKLFAPRKGGNSFYTSYCIVDGKGVLWYNDCKFYLCGRVVGPEWFE